MSCNLSLKVGSELYQKYISDLHKVQTKELELERLKDQASISDEMVNYLLLHGQESSQTTAYIEMLRSNSRTIYEQVDKLVHN